MSQIPQKKHTRDELAALQAQQAMQQPQMATHFANHRAPRWLVIMNYLFTLVPPAWFLVLKMSGRSYFEMQDVYFLGFLALVPVLVSVFILFRYNLSRHNAVFAFILLLLGAMVAGVVLTSDPLLKKELKQLVMPKEQREASTAQPLEGPDLSPDEIRRSKREVRRGFRSAADVQSPNERALEADLKVLEAKPPAKP